MANEDPRYWFRAKRYGWGWGLPLTWEGWVVLGSWSVLAVLAGGLLVPARPVLFAAVLTVLSAALIAVCYKKGEPPGWRWG